MISKNVPTWHHPQIFRPTGESSLFAVWKQGRSYWELVILCDKGFSKPAGQARDPKEEVGDM